VVRPASLSSGRFPGGRVRGSVTIEAARGAACCRDACRCSSVPGFRSLGLNAKCARRVASAAKHHDHLWRVAKKGSPRDPTLMPKDHHSSARSSGCWPARSRADGSGTLIGHFKGRVIRDVSQPAAGWASLAPPLGFGSPTDHRCLAAHPLPGVTNVPPESVPVGGPLAGNGPWRARLRLKQS
jgi:hypothetical protein